MFDLLAHAGYMPHGQCFRWQPDLVALHVVSDALTALSYYSIPAAIVYFARRRPDWEQGWVFGMFALFILSCGTTHALGAWTIWEPDYWTLGTTKAVTAAASVGTAAMLWLGMPTALRLPSPAQLRLANTNLLREVEQRERAIDALAESEARFRGAFDFAPIGMALVAPEGRWLRVNRALSELVGYSEAELLSRDFQSITEPEDLERDLLLLRETLAGRRDGYALEKRYLHREGRVVWVALSLFLVRDARREPLYFVAQMQDITARREAEAALKRAHQELERRVAERTRELEETNGRLAREIEERQQAEQAVRGYAERLERTNAQLAATSRRLEELARTDDLSGLSNRRHLMELLERAFYSAQRYGHPFCVLMIDIDHFKQVNDAHGHLAGDRVIAAVGALLTRELRDTDIAGRYGGEEFCVALPHIPLAQAVATANKLRERLRAEPVALEGTGTLQVTCSIGVAEWRPATASLKELLARADAALYRAKEQGRDRVELD